MSRKMIKELDEAAAPDYTVQMVRVGRGISAVRMKELLDEVYNQKPAEKPAENPPPGRRPRGKPSTSRSGGRGGSQGQQSSGGESESK